MEENFNEINIENQQYCWLLNSAERIADYGGMIFKILHRYRGLKVIQIKDYEIIKIKEHLASIDVLVREFRETLLNIEIDNKNKQGGRK